jgi:hypothetical protein
MIEGVSYICVLNHSFSSPPSLHSFHSFPSYLATLFAQIFR